MSTQQANDDKECDDALMFENIGEFAPDDWDLYLATLFEGELGSPVAGAFPNTGSGCSNKDEFLCCDNQLNPQGAMGDYTTDGTQLAAATVSVTDSYERRDNHTVGERPPAKESSGTPPSWKAAPPKPSAVLLSHSEDMTLSTVSSTEGSRKISESECQLAWADGGGSTKRPRTDKSNPPKREDIICLGYSGHEGPLYTKALQAFLKGTRILQCLVGRDPLKKALQQNPKMMFRAKIFLLRYVEEMIDMKPQLALFGNDKKCFKPSIEFHHESSVVYFEKYKNFKETMGDGNSLEKDLCQCKDWKAAMSLLQDYSTEDEATVEFRTLLQIVHGSIFFNYIAGNRGKLLSGPMKKAKNEDEPKVVGQLKEFERDLRESSYNFLVKSLESCLTDIESDPDSLSPSMLKMKEKGYLTMLNSVLEEALKTSKVPILSEFVREGGLKGGSSDSPGPNGQHDSGNHPGNGPNDPSGGGSDSGGDGDDQDASNVSTGQGSFGGIEPNCSNEAVFLIDVLEDEMANMALNFDQCSFSTLSDLTQCDFDSDDEFSVRSLGAGSEVRVQRLKTALTRFRQGLPRDARTAANKPTPFADFIAQQKIVREELGRKKEEAAQLAKCYRNASGRNAHDIFAAQLKRQKQDQVKKKKEAQAIWARYGSENPQGGTTVDATELGRLKPIQEDMLMASTDVTVSPSANLDDIKARKSQELASLLTENGCKAKLMAEEYDRLMKSSNTEKQKSRLHHELMKLQGKGRVLKELADIFTQTSSTNRCGGEDSSRIANELAGSKAKGGSIKTLAAEFVRKMEFFECKEIRSTPDDELAKVKKSCVGDLESNSIASSFPRQIAL